jgi:peptidoglycan/LPS O-acetylase OafA/YrhL
MAAAETSYLPEVDALRCWAVVAVVAYHCGLAPFGWAGVWLFFVISGFAITTSLLASAKRAESRVETLRNFYIRRCLRIWPLYYLFLVVNAVVLLALSRQAPLTLLPWLATFTYNMYLPFSPTSSAIRWDSFGPLWTLAVEEQFYLLYPLLFVCLGRRALSSAMIMLLIASPIIRWAWGDFSASLGLNKEHVAFSVYCFAPAHFDAFAAGVLLALNRRSLESLPMARKQFWTELLGVAVLVSAIAYAAVYAGMQTAQQGHFSLNALRNLFSGILYGNGREIFLYTILYGAGAALLMAVITGHPLLMRLARLPGTQALGRVSFGIYMFNIPVLSTMNALIPALAGPHVSVVWRLVRFTIGFSVASVLATGSLFWFERRFLGLRKFFR